MSAGLLSGSIIDRYNARHCLLIAQETCVLLRQLGLVGARFGKNLTIPTYLY